MKNNYISTTSRWLFLFGLLISQTLFAQTAPVVRWQRVIPTSTNPGPISNRAIIIKNGTSGYFVSSGDRRLLSLNSNGDITSDTPITGLFPNGGTSPSLNVSDIAVTGDANVVLAVQDNAGTSIQKRTVSGGVIWNNRLFSYSNDYSYTATRLVANPDGSLVCFTTYQDRRVLFGEQYVVAIKLSSSGTQEWNKIIRYPAASVTIVEQAIAGPNGQYILAGNTYAPADNNTFFRGWAAAISGSGDVVWQRRYNDINGLTAIAPFGNDGSAYVISGPLFNKPVGVYTASPIVIDGTGNINSSLPIGVVPDAAFNSIATLTAVPATNRPAVYVEAFDTQTSIRGGDMQLAAFSSENKVLWSRPIGGSGHDYNYGPSVVATDNGFVVVGITESTDGDVQGKQNSLPATWIVKLEDPNKSLLLTQPTYNCTTGAITFNSTGGDGSTITYSAPGIMRSSATSNTGTVEQGLRNDPKTITITATQSGQSTSYSFDLKAFCGGTTPTTPTPTPNPPTTGGTLTLTQPTYNCSTGAITFNTTGGNGSTITYTAPGIMRSSATSNTGTVEQGLRNDPKTILITAMQSGQLAAYSFDFKSFCSGSTPTTPTTPTTPPVTGGTLSLSAYVGNCASQTPLIVFKTAGGDGTPITFSAPGVVRRFPTDSSGTIETGLRNDPKPITVSALQSGKSVSYVVDLPKICDPTPIIGKPLDNLTLTAGQGTYKIIAQSGINFYDPYVLTDITGHHARATYMSFRSAGLPDSLYAQNYDDGGNNYYFRLFGKPTTAGVYTVTVTATVNARSVSTTFTITVLPANAQPVTPTPPATGNTLTLTAPTYNCSTGDFTFNYSGGDSSPVEFQAAGITSWTTKRNQFVDKDSRTANDVKPFTLMARQNGQVVTYTWDLKAACGRSARLAVAEAVQALELTVKGNPVGNTAIVEIRGAEGQAVQLDLLNASGHVLEQRHIEQAGAVEEQRFELQRQPSGMLFLRAQNGQQQQTVKLIKQ